MSEQLIPQILMWVVLLGGSMTATHILKKVFFCGTNGQDQSTLDSVFPDFVTDAKMNHLMLVNMTGMFLGWIIDFDVVPGKIITVSGSDDNGPVPAIDECCVGNKSY